MDMNTLLAQMLSSPQGEYPDPMEALAQQVAARYGAAHPFAQLVRLHLAQSREQAEADQPVEDDEDADLRTLDELLHQRPALEVDPPPPRRAASSARKQMVAMAVELREMRHRSEVFARAVGACNACWGGDPECPNCHGAGVPGAFAIDQELFERFIAPALAQYGGRADASTPVGSAVGKHANHQSQNGE